MFKTTKVAPAKFNITFVILCLGVFLNFLSAENLEFRLNHIDVKKGLSNNTVMSLIQDHRGYMWIGTETGLNLYDGYNIKVYRHQSNDTTSLNTNGIAHLFIDRKNENKIADRSKFSDKKLGRKNKEILNNEKN